MITDTLGEQIAQAMKAKDSTRLSALRMLSSALSYERIDRRRDLSADEELTIVRREAKKRHEAMEAYQKAGRDDLFQKEKAELTVLEAFLPPQLPQSELEKIVNEVVKESQTATAADIGRIIGAVIAKTKGQADGATVARLVKTKLA